MSIEIVTNVIEFIAKLISGFREIIAKLILALNLPEQTSMTLVFAGLSIFLGYLWLKQWVANTLFFKLSTLINLILISLLLFLLFTRIG